MAIERQDVQPPALGEHGEPCAGCGAPLAADQRYCLNCGRRRGGPRVDFAATWAGDESGYQRARRRGAAPGAPEGTGRRRSRSATTRPLAAVGGIAVLGLMLLVGVLIGKGNNDHLRRSPPRWSSSNSPRGGAAEGERGSPKRPPRRPGQKKSEKVDTGAKRVKGGLTGAAKNSDATVQASKGGTRRTRRSDRRRLRGSPEETARQNRHARRSSADRQQGARRRQQRRRRSNERGGRP